jgi:hypothetical protein
MVEIAAELERVGFRTPTVFQTKSTPARQRRFRSISKTTEEISPEETSRTQVKLAGRPEDLAVQTSQEKVQKYLGLEGKQGR